MKARDSLTFVAFGLWFVIGCGARTVEHSRAPEQGELLVDGGSVTARGWAGSCVMRAEFPHGSQATVIVGQERVAVARAAGGNALFIWVLFLDRLEPTAEIAVNFAEVPARVEMLCSPSRALEFPAPLPCVPTVTVRNPSDAAGCFRAFAGEETRVRLIGDFGPGADYVDVHPGDAGYEVLSCRPPAESAAPWRESGLCG